MSMLVTPKFDVLRGYPNGSALAWPFPIKTTGSPAAPQSVPIGSIVTIEAQGTQTVVTPGTTPNTSIAPNKDAWLVVEGNDDFSGTFVGGCMCVKLGSGVIFETDYFTAGTWTVGVAVSYSAGKIKVKASNEQIIGYVLEDNSATTGVVRISC